ncbi:hypothetical protein PG984_014522 [Apiospora sp. TS-2023a]
MTKIESKPTNKGKCGRPPNSAYLELMKDDEDWRQLKDASERRKIQNRLAQRAYRRNLRSRNQEVEVLREQLLRLREVDGERTTNTVESKTSRSVKTRSRASPKTKAVQANLPNEWIPSSYEMGRSVSPLGENNSCNPQFFDRYQDSDDSISFASGSSPSYHSLQSEETDLDTRIIYDGHTGLSPLPSTYSSMYPCERGCSSAGEDPSLPMHPFHPTLDYESSGTTTNRQHLAPIPHRSSSRYATPIEFSYEEESSFCYGYPTNTTPSESGGPLVSIQPSITDFPAATPGFHTHATGGRPRDYTMSSPPDFANIHPALLYSASSPPPPPPGTTPGSQQPTWPDRNDCTVPSLLHIALAGGCMETVRLILDHWPELAHMVDSEGYPAV